MTLKSLSFLFCNLVVFCICGSWQVCGVHGQECSIWTQFSNQNAVGCSFTRSGSTLIDCLYSCNNNPGCSGVDLDGGDCWQCVANLSLRFSNTINHHSLTTRFIGACYRTACVQLTGYRMQDGIESSSTTVSGCLTECINKDGCVGIDWDPTNRRCWLSGSASPTIVSSSSDVRHYYVRKSGDNACSSPLPVTSTSTTSSTTTTTSTTSSTTTTTSTTSSTTTTTSPIKTTNVSTSSAHSVNGTVTFPADINMTTLSATMNTADVSPTASAIVDGSGLSPKQIAVIAGVVGGGGGLILIIVVILLIVYFCKRRSVKEKEPPGDAAYLPTDSSVLLPQLPAYFNSLFPVGLKQQFESLPNDDIRKKTVGSKADNKKKNRFKNILPYDSTRVKLTSTDGMPADDNYINASLIQCFKTETIGYIASQGPKPETVEDFWHMIWHEKIDVVAMIVLTVEAGKSRCAQYWPLHQDEKTNFGQISVTLTGSTKFSEFIRRTLKVQQNNMAPRTVIQLQYLVWPDKSVPDNLWSLLAYHRRLRALRSTSTTGGPMLVHCSAGVGRTGTLIALDMLLHEAEKTGKVDVFGVVRHLRQQRMHMVQTEEQYELLFSALLDIHKCGNTVTAKSDVQKDYQKMNKNVTAKLQRQYQTLTEMKRAINSDDDSEALHPSDNAKNRDQKTIPSNIDRVRLLPSTDGSDYINAVYVKGYKMPASFILTQLPMPNTVSDFWQMIVEKQCRTVVMLERVTPHSKDTAQFWPTSVSDQPSHYGSATVTLKSTKPGNQDGSILMHLLHVSWSNKKEHAQQDVCILELTNWSTDRDTPDKTDEFLELIDLVEKSENLQPEDLELLSSESTRRRSVIVMCLDGASRSGLFAATSTAVDRLNCDNELDVFLCCRYVTKARPQAITSLNQYEFIHRTAANSISWTPKQVIVIGPVYDNIDSSSKNDNLYENSLDIAASRQSMTQKHTVPATSLDGPVYGNIDSSSTNNNLYENSLKIVAASHQSLTQQHTVPATSLNEVNLYAEVADIATISETQPKPDQLP